MTKLYTDLDQSQRLAEILSIESADFHFSANQSPQGYLEKPIWGNPEYADYSAFPCWSLSSLLNYLREIDFFPEIDANEFSVTMNINYYDENGVFHVERRLGCIGCPMKSNNGLADFKRYPLMAKAWIEAAKVYLDGHPNCSSKNKFGDAYNVFYNNVFCESYEDFVSKTSVTLWGTKPDIRALMSDYFGVEL